MVAETKLMTCQTGNKLALSSGMSLPLVHHPDYDAVSVGDTHRFPMRKYTLVAQNLRAQGRLLSQPRPVRATALETVHAPDYVHAVLTTSLSQKESRKIGFEISPAIVRRACAAVGGTLHAAQFALAAGAAVNLAGGSHHAHADMGAGFCVFNDVAVAAEDMLATAQVQRILIVDLDVHQGDGTAQIFADREEVFTLSVHCQDNWPTYKPPSDIDIGLPQGTPDAVYLTTLRQVLDRAFALAQPDFVFYNAGVDPHMDDRLGKLALSDGGLAARDRQVADMCAQHRVPICGVLGGGYSKEPADVVRRHFFLVQALEKIVS